MSERRRVFGEKFVELGNFTIVALIFTQFTGENKSSFVILIGFILTAILWIVGFFLLQKGRRHK